VEAFQKFSLDTQNQKGMVMGKVSLLTELIRSSRGVLYTRKPDKLGAVNCENRAKCQIAMWFSYYLSFTVSWRNSRNETQFSSPKTIFEADSRKKGESYAASLINCCLGTKAGFLSSYLLENDT